MEDHGKPEGTGSRSAGQSPQATKFQPFKIPHQSSESKRSKKFNLTPNPQPEKPSPLSRETVASENSALESKPQSSNTPTSSTAPYSKPGPEAPGTEQSINDPAPEHSVRGERDAKELEKDELESDDEYMSLAVMMKLSHELSLLQEYLEVYRKFNRRLGRKYNPCTLDQIILFADTNGLPLDIASGPRHQGLLKNIFSTIERLERAAAHLEYLRQEKQRGTPQPCRMELAVQDISQRYRDRGQHVWDVMDEKVDMTNEEERAMWVEKKAEVLHDVTRWMLRYLQHKERIDRAWKEKDVAILKLDWEDRWEDYGKMEIEDLKQVGWIMDV